MAEKMKAYKIFLSELPRKTIVSVSYMIKIPNFFILPENDDNVVKVNSPSFEFANTSWRFQFKSKQEYKIGRCIKMFDASLERLNSDALEHVISCSILLLDADNGKHAHHYGKITFDEDLTCWFLWSFKNDNLFYDRRETLTLIVHLICDEVPEATDVIREFIPLPSIGMTENVKNCRVSISELPKKTLSFVNYTMKMPNFVVNPELINSVGTINSQSFEFCDASWQFLFSEEKALSEWTMPLGLYLVRLNSKIRKHLISYKISLLDEDGKTYEDKYGIFLYREDHNDICTWTFDKRDIDDEQDTLTFTVSLICVESPEENANQEQLKKQLQDDFKRLLLNGKNYDLTLRVGEKEFRVHKDVLMARSPVFETMLTHDVTETNEGFINITDCDPEVMEQFLFYVYCGKLDPLNIANAIGLYYISDKYNMVLLKNQCSEFIKKSLTPSTICDVIKLSTNHSDTDLLEYATEFFRNHMHDIFTTSEWMSFLTKDVITANELLVKASKKWKST